MKIIDYSTVSGNEKDFPQSVKDCINEGWVPFGGVCVVGFKGEAADLYSQDEYFYFQAMVKYEHN